MIQLFQKNIGEGLNLHHIHVSMQLYSSDHPVGGAQTKLFDLNSSVMINSFTVAFDICYINMYRYICNV